MLHRSLYQSFLPTGEGARGLVWKYSPEFRRPRHFHSEPELNLIVAGSATFGVGGGVVTAVRGELLGFPAGQDHALLEASPDLKLFAIGMAASFSSEVLRQDPYSVALPLHVRVLPHTLRALIARASAVVDQGGVDAAVAEIWEQVDWLRHRHAQSLRGAMHVLTRRALSVISDAPDVGREMLALQTRAHASEISRYFHRDIGMTLGQYRTRLRLLRLIGLMDAQPSSLSAAASHAGFGSYSQCHRMFQAELGCAPRDFFGSGLRERMQAAYLPNPVSEA